MKKSVLKELIREVIKEESKGLWANIQAKHQRGEKPARKGSEAYKAAVGAAKRITAATQKSTKKK